MDLAIGNGRTTGRSAQDTVLSTAHGDVVGHVDDGWHSVAAAFARGVHQGEEPGAALVVRHGGHVVVSLSAGTTGHDGEFYTTETTQLVFSATKGLVAVLIGSLVTRGVLDLESPVYELWPEFAAGGKSRLTVAEVLAHRGGLYATDRRFSLAEVLRGQGPTEALAAQAPLWPPGERHGYHAVTWSWLAGRIVLAATGMSVGQALERWVAAPLHLDLSLGEHRPLTKSAQLLDPPPAPAYERVFMRVLQARRHPVWRAMSFDGALEAASPAELFNRDEVRFAELAGATGRIDAHSLARAWDATLPSRPDGVWDERTRAAMTRPRSAGWDRTLWTSSVYGAGVQRHAKASPFTGPEAYGHYGISGSVGFADPRRDLAVGYVTRRMSSDASADPRVTRILAALRSRRDT